MLNVPWYTNTRLQVHTQTYSNRNAAVVEARKAAEYGWRVDADEESDPPFSDRNWATGGPVGTFVAGMQNPGDREVVVTYVRAS